jgi:PPK2 family polyphosphate:nucleotide phosphotransferase
MKKIIDRFKIDNGKDFSLDEFDTTYSADYKKEDTEEILAELVKEIAVLQSKLYAEKRYALLVLFQGMDAAGKDGAIAHTLSGLNPQWCEVHSFKQPSVEELNHDFLWRHYKLLPEFGQMGVHNRSHYENVLITKVHPELLLKENLPGIKDIKDIDKDFWKTRYESIVNFEKHITANGVVMIKFFLHLSKDEQKKRFLERIDDPVKNWKFSAADIEERAYFDDYMKAYQKAIRETSTRHCPWYILPADKKWFTRIAISTIILQKLKELNLEYPVLPKEEMNKLAGAKRLLEGGD